MARRPPIADAGQFAQTSGMQTDVFATRLARNMLPAIAIIGVGAMLLAGANLFLGAVDDEIVRAVAFAVDVVAGVYFLAVVFDMRFQQAIAALNARRRAIARERGGLARLGWGLPGNAEPPLSHIAPPLLAMTLLAANVYHHGPSTALLCGAFMLCCLVAMGLAVQHQPDDR